LLVWKTPTPNWFGSIAIRKKSPYQVFMRNVIFQITEKGQLDWIISKFLSHAKPQDCKTGLAKGNPLGLKKISFPFFVAFIGLLLSVLTGLLEKLFWKPTLTVEHQTQINHSKDVLLSAIQHLRSSLSQANAVEWDCLDGLDDFLVKIQDSQVQYNQL
jgi:hypothetical protein